MNLYESLLLSDCLKFRVSKRFTVRCVFCLHVIDQKRSYFFSENPTLRSVVQERRSKWRKMAQWTQSVTVFVKIANKLTNHVSINGLMANQSASRWRRSQQTNENKVDSTLIIVDQNYITRCMAYLFCWQCPAVKFKHAWLWHRRFGHADRLLYYVLDNSWWITY